MNVNDICRICLKSGDIMSPLFESNVTELDPILVTDFLKMFTKIHIAQEDGMPDQLCNDCFHEIQRMYAFMVKCEKTETVLKQLKSTQNRLREMKQVDVFKGNSNGHSLQESTEEHSNSNHHSYGNFTTSNRSPFIIKSVTHLPNRVQPKPAEAIVVTPDVFDNATEQEDITIDLDDSDDDDEITTDQPANTSFESIVTNGDEHIVLRLTSSENTTILICPICRRPFKHRKNLKRHIEIVHSRVDLSIQCEVCKRTYRNKDSLRSHMLSMHSSHATSGKETGKLKCCVCRRLFGHIKSLKAHFQTHKEYSCRYCLRIFRRPFALQQHLACKKVGRFQCSQCPKIFVRETCLKGHMMDHIEQAGEECKLCSKMFAVKGDYRNHMREVHGIESYPCGICSEIFNDQKTLDDHIEMEHSEDISYAEIEMADLNADESAGSGDLYGYSDGHMGYGDEGESDDDDIKEVSIETQEDYS